MTFTADHAASVSPTSSSASAARRRRIALALAVGLTTTASMPVLADLTSPQAQRVAVDAPRASGVAFLTSLMDDPKPATSADALSLGAQQLGAKAYEEALATLQQAKADELTADQKPQLAAALAEAEKAAGERKAARAAFEQGEAALATGDSLGAVTKYAAAAGTPYADAATVDKANTQTALALSKIGDLKPVYSSAKSDLESGNLELAKAKFWALDAVGYKAGLLNKSPADYLKTVNEKQGTGLAAAAVPADVSNQTVADASATVIDTAPGVVTKPMTGREAYVAAREAYGRGDVSSAKELFSRSSELGYKGRLGEAGPAKMLAEIGKKEAADSARLARAMRDRDATAVASIDMAPAIPATGTEPAAGTEVARANDTTAMNLTNAVVVAQPTEPTTPAATGTTPAEPTPAAEPTTPAATIAEPTTPAATDNSLRGTADTDRLRQEQNLFRAQTYVSQGDEARAGSRYQDALVAYEEALKLNPNNTAAQAGKAAVLQLTGNTVAQNDIFTRQQAQIDAKVANITFTVNSSLEQARQARTDADFSSARRALIQAQSARDADAGIFNAQQLAGFDGAIRTETNLVNAAEAAAIEAKRQEDQSNTLNATVLAANQALEAQRNTIAALIKQSRQLTEQGKYADALKVIDQILNIEPRNDYANGVRPLIMDRKSLAGQRDVKERIAENLTEVLNQAEEARVPIPDLLVYTPDWPDLSKDRDATLARERGGEGDAATMALLAKSLPELRFDGVPFVDVIEFLRDTTQANIFVNWTAIEGAGVDKNAPITTRLRNVKFSKVLGIILESAGGGVVRLGYTIDDGVITISTQDDLAKNVSTQTYDIRDLLVSIPDFDNAPQFSLENQNQNQGGGSGGGGGGGGNNNQGLFGDSQDNDRDNENQVDRAELVEQIINLIRDTIASDTWKENGGLIGAVQELGGQLIVTQTPENLTAIRQLLEKLRETRAIQVNVEARFLTVQRNFLEEVGVDFDFQFNVDYSRFPNTGTDIGTGVVNPTSDFSPVLVRQNNVSNDTNGVASGFTAPGSLVTGVNTNLASQAGGAGYGISTSISAFLDDFRASLLLRAVQLGQNATTLTAPRLTLFNGQRAFVLVSTQQQYVSNLRPVVGTQAVGYESQIGTVNSGVVLDVQATVSSDRKYVTLTVNPQLSRLVALRTFSFAAGQTVGGTNGGTVSQTLVNTVQLPEVENTQLSTTVSVPDRGTLLLGGQTLMGEIERESGVPVLSKIPFLKRLFTNRGTAKDEQVLLILIKPTIIIQREVEQNSFPLLEAN